MKKDVKCDCKSCGCRKWHHHKMCGGVYGLGFLGAAIYYVSMATGFWMGVLGILKAIVWPAFIVYHALKAFGI